MPILLLRQDGAPARMLGRARAKAYTAANLGLDTVEFPRRSTSRRDSGR